MDKQNSVKRYTNKGETNMNESRPLSIKTVLLLLLALSLIYFQINTSQKLVNMENQLSMMSNEIVGIKNLVSQQNYMITEEKADYIFYGITYENEKLNAKLGVLSMKMDLSFTKLPADSKVFLDIQSTKDHYQSTNGDPGMGIDMANADVNYDTSQVFAFNADSLNRYSSDMTFDIGQNYKVTLVIETPTDTFREILGVIAALEWSEPAQFPTVEVVNLSSVSNTANFIYKLSLASLAELNSGFEFYDTKSLYDFNKLYADNNSALEVVNEVVKASYKITYLDKVIKEGEMTPYVHPETGVAGWKADDKVEFEIDDTADYSSAIKIEFTTIDESGNTTTIKRGTFQ